MRKGTSKFSTWTEEEILAYKRKQNAEKHARQRAKGNVIELKIILTKEDRESFLQIVKQFGCENASQFARKIVRGEIKVQASASATDDSK